MSRMQRSDISQKRSYYSDITQTYIGSSLREIDDIQYETEEFMRGEHYSLSTIYKSEIIKEE